MRDGTTGGVSRISAAATATAAAERILRAIVWTGAALSAMETALLVGGERSCSAQDAGATSRATGGAIAASRLEREAPSGGAVVLASDDRDSLEPHLRSGVEPGVRERLYESFGLAVRKIRKVATCGELFVRLGSDGADRLRHTLYYPAPPEVIAHRCAKGALAATNIGSGVTWLCPAFGSVSAQRAAMTLIHEGLHFAGLNERPQVTGALSSAEINAMVRDACGL